VETVQPAPLPLVVRAPATLEAKQSLTFKAEFDGPVLAKNYQEGDVMAKDQWLIKIGRDKIQMDYQTKSDAVKNAKADLIKAEKEKKLQKVLYNRQAVSRSSVEDAAQAQVRAAQALRTAEEAFRLEQVRWNKSKLIAPFGGTVIKDFVGNQPNVASGKEILTLADVSGFSVRARVDELEIAQIHEGQEARVRIEAFHDTWLPARVDRIGTQSDEAGAPEIPVTLHLDGTEGLSLRTNLAAEARINTGETGPVLSAPLTAIANEDGRAKVWVLNRLNRLETRRVETGKSNPDRVEITKGLEAGDRVCVQADPHFSEGMKVNVENAGPSHD
jgi:RND family efflux transporter MFP subunit